MSEDLDLSDEEIIRVYLGDTVERTVDGETISIEITSERVDLTKTQAGVIVDALSAAQYENDIQLETARRTRTRLVDRFGLDK